MKPSDIMKQAHDKKNQEPAAIPSKIVESKIVEPKEVKEVKPAVKVEPAVVESTVNHAKESKPLPESNKLPEENNRVWPNSAIKMMRPGIPKEMYGLKPVGIGFNCYSEEIEEWLSKFSKRNQRNGGCALTKSQIVEICLDVIMYDLELTGKGYKSQAELREGIQKLIKG